MNESQDALLDRARSLADAQDQLMEGLIELREARGLKQAQVAERMGVSQSAVSQFERYDSNPTFATIRRYALAVGARLRIDVLPDDGNSISAAPISAPQPVRGEALGTVPERIVDWGRPRMAVSRG